MNWNYNIQMESAKKVVWKNLIVAIPWKGKWEGESASVFKTEKIQIDILILAWIIIN